MKKHNTRKIKVLHIVGRMDRGGVELVLMNILRYIDKEKICFIFLCYEDKVYDYEDEIIKLGAKIIRIPAPRDVGLVRYLNNFRRIVRIENIDIVHAHNYSMVPILAAKLSGVKLRLAHSHTTGVEYIPGRLKRLNILLSKKIISTLSTSRLACEVEAGKYMFGKKSFRILHNGIIINNFLFSDIKRKVIRKNLNLPAKSVVIGHVGRMVPVKNQKFIIKIFKEYLNLNPNSYLLLVGDGKQRLENEEYVRKLKLSNRVRFLGSRDDIGDIYSAMDIFIFPSLNEGLGLTLVEAQANGLNSVASDSVPASSKLTNGVEFFSLSEGADAWALKLYNKIDTSRFDESVSMRLGPYNITNSVKEVENLYLEIYRDKNETKL